MSVISIIIISHERQQQQQQQQHLRGRVVDHQVTRHARLTHNIPSQPPPSLLQQSLSTWLAAIIN